MEEIMIHTGIISHIEIYVSNLERTRLFWERLLLQDLGYKVYQEWRSGVSYILDKTYIVFVQSSKIDPKYDRTKVGLNHLAFMVKTNKPVDEIRSQLLAATYTELYADRYTHAGGSDSYALYFEDPDRIKVEVVSAE